MSSDLRSRRVQTTPVTDELGVFDESENGGVTDKILVKGSKSRELIVNSTEREKELEKWKKLVEGASESAPPSLVPYLKAAAPAVSFLVVLFEISLPILVQVVKLLNEMVNMLPLDVMYICAGLGICFFGGMYPTTMAALEAWRQCGGKQAAEHATDLVAEFRAVLKASDDDDKKDDDGDGVADVDTLTGKELVLRKAKLAVVAMDPDKVNGALQGMYSGWVGVLAVLQVQFAKTIALGAAIGDFLFKTCQPMGTRVLVHLLPSEYHKWIPLILAYACKSVAISLAWQLQRILSAFHSAIRGGLMVSRAGLAWLTKKGYGPTGLDPDASHVDEVLGWSLALAGFYFQYSYGFAPSWLMSLVLWPLSVAESYITWTLSSTPGAPE